MKKHNIRILILAVTMMILVGCNGKKDYDIKIVVPAGNKE